MDFLLQMLATAMIFTSGFFGFGDVTSIVVDKQVESVEIGLAELSPAGEQGGFAVPASGCAYLPAEHGESGACDGYPRISVDPPLVRSGEDITVSWEIGGHVNCVLAGKGIAGTASSDGNQGVELSSEITFTITCDSGSDAAVGKILPLIQET